MVRRSLRDQPEDAFTELQRGLVTERLVLRAPRPEDAAALWAAVDESRDHLRPWVEWVRYYDDLEAAERFVENAQLDFAAREALFLLVVDRADPTRVLGGSGFHNIHWGVPAFEVGYWLRASAAGRGYMTEAVAAQAAFAVERFGARRVAITCDATNARSAAVPRRLGFPLEGRLRNDGLTPQGHLRDTLVFAVTSWPPSESDSRRVGQSESEP